MEIDAYLSGGKTIQSYAEALAFLDGYALVRHPRLVGQAKLTAMEIFLGFLGQPQHTLHLLHVAGTSGKGSTATILCHLLRTTGRRVGLTVSPHFLDIRERLQINNQLISEERCVRLLNDTLPALRLMQNSIHGLPSYFGLLTGMAVRLFAEERVEYAVVETGVGGRFDITNAIHAKTKIALLTKIGLDHTKALGDRLEKIAWEKAGIIPRGGEVFALEQPPGAWHIIQQGAGLKQAVLHCIKKQGGITIRSMDERGVSFDLKTPRGRWTKLELGLLGEHQVENASLALSVFERIVERDGLTLDRDKVRAALKTVSLAGRGEIICHPGKTIVLDVAHNPQKMEALCHLLRQVWPDRSMCFVLAFGHEAQGEAMLELIRPFASSMIVCDFIVGEGAYRYKFQDTDMLETLAKKYGYLSIHRALTPEEARTKALSASQDMIVVTGSLHFVSVIRSHLLLTK